MSPSTSLLPNLGGAMKQALFGLLLAATRTQGFFPTDFRESAFGNGGVSHESQTRSAYDQLAAQYFPDISPITANMIKARTAMAQANIAVDDDQDHSALHFDGENFDGGQTRLVQLKNTAITALLAADGDSARTAVGGALHTVQDFYAHTNWVELGNGDINYDLGKDGVSIAHADFSQPTCSNCTTSIGSIIAACPNCQHNTDGFGLLTSGYYFGEDSPPAGTDIPNYKCHHGGATDSTHGAGIGIIGSDLLRNPTPGINKDSLNCFFSPHYFNHAAAVALAIKASAQFIDDIFTDGHLTDLEKKILFGVGTTLAFAIDTTGSMADIIASVQQQSIDLATARVGTPDEAIKYVISPFNDPTTGPLYVTSSLSTFEAQINSLGASGGGDCPELSLTGILNAMSVMDGPADLFMMTDAAAKDEDLSSQVVSTAISKKINLQIFKFDSNCDDGVSDKRKRVDSASNRVYGALAAGTGGSYHSLPRDQVSSIGGLLDTLTLSSSTAIFKITSTAASGTPISFPLPVDSKMTEFSISLLGEGFTATLTAPDGSNFDLTSTGVTVSSVADGEFINVKSPQAGTWTVVVSGDGSFSCDATGVSSLYLSAFDFVALAGRPGHDGYYPIDGQPAYDHEVAAVATIDGGFTSATFDLRGPDGTHVVDAHMKAGSGKLGDPPTNSFYGEMQLTQGTLYAYCQGIDSSGAPFLRVLSTVFTPILSGTTDTGFNDTDIWAGIETTTISTLPPTTTSTTSTTSSYSNSTYSYHNHTHTKTSSHHSHTYTPPVYSYPYSTYKPTSPGGGISTHSTYMTSGCDSTKTSTYLVGSNTYTATSIYLCTTCSGPNYPDHTGSGPWSSSPIVVSGYPTGSPASYAANSAPPASYSAPPSSAPAYAAPSYSAPPAAESSAPAPAESSPASYSTGPAPSVPSSEPAATSNAPAEYTGGAAKEAGIFGAAVMGAVIGALGIVV